MRQNTRLGVIAGLLIGLLLLLLVVGDFSFVGLAAVLVGSALTGLLVWLQMRSGESEVEVDDEEEEEYMLDESLDERLGSLFRDNYDDEVEPGAGPPLVSDEPVTGFGATGFDLGERRSEPLFDSQTFDEPSGASPEPAAWSPEPELEPEPEPAAWSPEPEAEPEPQPFSLSEFRARDNGSAPPAADDSDVAADPLAAYEEEFRSDSSVSSFDDLRMPPDAREASADDLSRESPEPPEPPDLVTSFDDLRMPPDAREVSADDLSRESPEPPEPPDLVTSFDDLRPPERSDEASRSLESFLRSTTEPTEPVTSFDDLRVPPEPEAAPPIEEFRTPGAFEEPAPVAEPAVEADENIFAEPGVIDEAKVDTDEAILGAAHASSLSATLTEEEANVETREILGRVAALLEKYE